MSDDLTAEQERSAKFTHRAGWLLSRMAWTWMISVPVLGIACIWWHQAWMLILVGLAVCWIGTTFAVYDRRWDDRYDDSLGAKQL